MVDSVSSIAKGDFPSMYSAVLSSPSLPSVAILTSLGSYCNSLQVVPRFVADGAVFLMASAESDIMADHALVCGRHWGFFNT